MPGSSVHASLANEIGLRIVRGDYPPGTILPNEAKWSGPYLRKDIPLDPWGRAYVYKFPGEKGDYDLFSYGKDGQPGGTGENADITNH